MGFLKKNMLYIGVIAVAVGGLWWYMSTSSGESATLSVDAVSPLSPDVLATLSSLNTIKLDSTIFSDPLFTSLADFSVVIPPQTSGRRNPFAPL